ncbi:uncharacterized protein LOC131039796 [Cryptomeria japonica]|uniref:uncharacterized protein LOC131039796 n=1 Tax=Cryptomeria japonica TaxID=3369 RepID=UPI0025AD2050|nr:uncharacterized protein LOC131039796 [Cryptomeria japonica]
MEELIHSSKNKDTKEIADDVNRPEMDEEEILQPGEVSLKKKDDSIILVDDGVQNTVDLSGDNRKYARDEDTESEASGFNFDSETKGDSEKTSKKDRNKAKRKRIVVDSNISESKAEKFEGKFIKEKKGKVTGKQMQRKKTSKESNKDISQILIDSEEEAEEKKKDEG